MQVLDRSDVQPACRLRGDQHLGIAGDLTCGADLLLVPSRQRGRPGRRSAAADVELLDQAPRELDEPSREDPAEAGDRRAVVVVELGVLGDRELEDEATALPILRDVPEARVQHAARGRPLDLPAGDRDAAALTLAEARERLDQLTLAVAVDARDADD